MRTTAKEMTTRQAAISLMSCRGIATSRSRIWEAMATEKRPIVILGMRCRQRKAVKAEKIAANPAESRYQMVLNRSGFISLPVNKIQMSWNVKTHRENTTVTSPIATNQIPVEVPSHIFFISPAATTFAMALLTERRNLTTRTAQGQLAARAGELRQFEH